MKMHSPKTERKRIMNEFSICSDPDWIQTDGLFTVNRLGSTSVEHVDDYFLAGGPQAYQITIMRN